MDGSKVRLPASVREPFTVHVNAVLQREGTDFRREGELLVFDRELVKEQRLGFWRWFLGAWGIGTYRRNDQVDIAWEDGGRPRLAHAVDIEPGIRAGGSGSAGSTPPTAPQSTEPSS